MRPPTSPTVRMSGAGAPANAQLVRAASDMKKAIWRPLLLSHTRSVQSALAVTSIELSGAKAAVVTSFLCPTRGGRQRWLNRSHTITCSQAGEAKRGGVFDMVNKWTLVHALQWCESHGAKWFPTTVLPYLLPTMLPHLPS